MKLTGQEDPFSSGDHTGLQPGGGHRTHAPEPKLQGTRHRTPCSPQGRDLRCSRLPQAQACARPAPHALSSAGSGAHSAIDAGQDAPAGTQVYTRLSEHSFPCTYLPNELQVQSRDTAPGAPPTSPAPPGQAGFAERPTTQRPLGPAVRPPGSSFTLPCQGRSGPGRLLGGCWALWPWLG